MAATAGGELDAILKFRTQLQSTKKTLEFEITFKNNDVEAAKFSTNYYDDDLNTTSSLLRRR